MRRLEPGSSIQTSAPPPSPVPRRRAVPPCGAGDRVDDRQARARCRRATAARSPRREALEGAAVEVRREARARGRATCEPDAVAGRRRPRARPARRRGGARCRPGSRAPARAAAGRRRTPSPSGRSTRELARPAPTRAPEAARGRWRAARATSSGSGRRAACPRRRGRARAGPRRAGRAGRPPRGGRGDRRAQLLGASGRSRSASSSSVLEERQRRAQLVARVGDEAALALERERSSRASISLSVSPSRASSSRPSGTGSRAPALEPRDLGRLGAHRARPAAAPPGDPVGRERGEQQRDGSADQEHARQRAERLLAVLSGWRRRRPRGRPPAAPGRRQVLVEAARRRSGR